MALVTGASRGLGRAMAGGLADAGATVVLAARDQAALDRAAQEIREAGGKADTLAFELSDRDAVEQAVPQLLARHGKLDIPAEQWRHDRMGPRSPPPPATRGNACSISTSLRATFWRAKPPSQ